MDADLAQCAQAGTVVVFYHPDNGCFARANRLAKFGPCVVVDNTGAERRSAAPALDPNITYIANGVNQGVATALNQGVDVLIRSGCRSAILFDQDSEPSDDLLLQLPQLLDEQRAKGVRVAVVGPAYEDARLGGTAPFVRFGYLKLQRIQPVGTALVAVDFLITSGSCINLDAWREIGPMDETLFIDFVDLEWCVRARSKGYAVLGAPALRLQHELGDIPVSLFGRAYPRHSPLRHYYLFRNGVALIKRAYVPWSWKSTELLKFPVRLVIYSTLMHPRLTHLRLSLLGIWHGLLGRSGAF